MGVGKRQVDPSRSLSVRRIDAARVKEQEYSALPYPDFLFH